jgi:uncharacterized protein (DUF3084 family)
MKRVILLLGVLLLMAAVWPIEIGKASQDRTSQMGGRPGEFHFILKEQADLNRIEFREVQARLERLKVEVAANASDDAANRRMLADLDSVSLFAASMQAQFEAPVGQTAGQVEQRLNTVKGQVMCGACHEGSSTRAAR